MSLTAIVKSDEKLTIKIDNKGRIPVGMILNKSRFLEKNKDNIYGYYSPDEKRIYLSTLEYINHLGSFPLPEKQLHYIGPMKDRNTERIFSQNCFEAEIKYSMKDGYEQSRIQLPEHIREQIRETQLEVEIRAFYAVLSIVS